MGAIGVTSPNTSHWSNQVVQPIYTRTRLAQSSDLELIPNTDCPGRLIPEMPQASPSDIGHKELTSLLRPHSPSQICTPHLLVILTEPACHHNSFWGSRCDSNHAPTISLKPGILSRRFRLFLWHTTHFTTRHISSLPMAIKSMFRQFRFYCLQFITFRLISAKTNLSRLPTQKIL